MHRVRLSEDYRTGFAEPCYDGGVLRGKGAEQRERACRGVELFVLVGRGRGSSDDILDEDRYSMEQRKLGLRIVAQQLMSLGVAGRCLLQGCIVGFDDRVQFVVDLCRACQIGLQQPAAQREGNRDRARRKHTLAS
jgi:hypothetical protein